MKTISTEWDSDKGPTDEQVDVALRILRADYWTTIRAMAKDIVERVKSGDVERDEVSDAVHEDADGSHYVIYTHANYQALLACDGDPTDEARDMGLENPTMAQLAYCAVRRDLESQVQAELDDLPEEDEAETQEVAT